MNTKPMTLAELMASGGISALPMAPVGSDFEKMAQDADVKEAAFEREITIKVESESDF